VTTDWQKVRLQEIITDESREDGRMPRTIECELIDDLVDKCIPGDEVQSECKYNDHNTSFPFARIYK
jgi:DNA replicative helicase MCM subunit Mcm2 (Cdc46/Mcm family)